MLWPSLVVFSLCSKGQKLEDTASRLAGPDDCHPVCHLDFALHLLSFSFIWSQCFARFLFSFSVVTQRRLRVCILDIAPGSAFCVLEVGTITISQYHTRVLYCFVCTCPPRRSLQLIHSLLHNPLFVLWAFSYPNGASLFEHALHCKVGGGR